MRVRIAAALLGVVLAACGDDGAGSAAIDARSDAGEIDAPCSCGPCEPDRAAGDQLCAPSLRCTWIVIQTDPDTAGKIGCVPGGTVPVGDPCMVGPAGETTGFDDCVAGAVCDDGVCRDVCEPSDPLGERCANDEACVTRPGLFANGDDEPIYGVCIEVPR